MSWLERSRAPPTAGGAAAGSSLASRTVRRGYLTSHWRLSATGRYLLAVEAELEQAIGRLTVTAAHVKTSLLRVLAPISGMDLGTTIAFVGRMQAEPLVDTIERLLEHRHLKDVDVVGMEWRSLKKELRDFFGFRGRVAHTSWVIFAGAEGPRDPPGVLRPWRRELDLNTLTSPPR